MRVVVGYTYCNLVLAQREMDGICMLARREAMGPDDFEDRARVRGPKRSERHSSQVRAQKDRWMQV